MTVNLASRPNPVAGRSGRASGRRRMVGTAAGLTLPVLTLGIDVAYPAAALRVWGLPYRGYKRGANRSALLEAAHELRRHCPWLAADDTTWGEVTRTDHAYDALICALVARTHHRQLCHAIPLHLRGAAAGKGWIAVPIPESLDRLIEGAGRREGAEDSPPRAEPGNGGGGDAALQPVPRSPLRGRDVRGVARRGGWIRPAVLSPGLALGGPGSALREGRASPRLGRDAGALRAPDPLAG